MQAARKTAMMPKWASETDGHESDSVADSADHAYIIISGIEGATLESLEWSLRIHKTHSIQNYTFKIFNFYRKLESLFSRWCTT